MSDYSKLKMTADKSEGSFVRSLQGQTGVGFQEKTHVHKDWWAKTQSYDEAMESLQRGAEEREDILEATKNICAINDNGNFKLQLLDGRTFNPTDHALSQFSIRTQRAKFYCNSKTEKPSRFRFSGCGLYGRSG